MATLPDPSPPPAVAPGAIPSRRAARTQAERRAQTRSQLIEATVRCIADRGYAATTTRGVADTAGLSLGALAHHFPSREDLIVATLDEVGQRRARELRARTTASPDSVIATEDLLDILWSFFNDQLFLIWIAVWLAAATDPDLYARLAPVEANLNTAIAEVSATLAPPDLPADAWRHRFAVAAHTMRGLALALAIEPRVTPPGPNSWPSARDQLVRLLDQRP